MSHHLILRTEIDYLPLTRASSLWYASILSRSEECQGRHISSVSYSTNHKSKQKTGWKREKGAPQGSTSPLYQYQLTYIDGIVSTWWYNFQTVKKQQTEILYEALFSGSAAQPPTTRPDRKPQSSQNRFAKASRETLPHNNNHPVQQ